jgi:hypothetical protein
MVETTIGGGLRLHRNDAPAPGTHWLRVRARLGKRDALGALVTVVAGGVRRTQPVISAYSFASASEPVAHFGLGAASAVESLHILWPDGKLERCAPPPVVDDQVTYYR